MAAKGRLSRADEKVLAAIERRGSEVLQSEIVTETGLSKTQVVNSIKRLVEEDCLRVEKVGNHNHYEVLKEGQASQVESQASQEKSTGSSTGSSKVKVIEISIKKSDVEIQISVPVDISQALLDHIIKTTLNATHQLQPAQDASDEQSSLTYVEAETRQDKAPIIQRESSQSQVDLTLAQTEQQTKQSDEDPRMTQRESSQGQEKVKQKRRPKKNKPAAETGQMTLIEPQQE